MFRVPRVLAIIAAATISLGGCERSAKRSDGGGPATRASAGDAAAVAASAPDTRPTTGPAPNPAQQDPAERLYGTWVAEDVDVKIGQVKIRLVFKKEGPVKIAAWSDMPFVGQVRDRSAPYEVHGNKISSDAIRGGTTVTYRFDGDDLVIEYQDGKTVRFHRA